MSAFTGSETGKKSLLVFGGVLFAIVSAKALMTAAKSAHAEGLDLPEFGSYALPDQITPDKTDWLRTSSAKIGSVKLKYKSYRLGYLPCSSLNLTVKYRCNVQWWNGDVGDFGGHGIDKVWLEAGDWYPATWAEMKITVSDGEVGYEGDEENPVAYLDVKINVWEKVITEATQSWEVRLYGDSRAAEILQKPS